MIFCARATRGRGLPSLDARSGRSISFHPWRANEQAWREHLYRSLHAVEVTPATSLNAGEELLSRLASNRSVFLEV